MRAPGSSKSNRWIYVIALVVTTFAASHAWTKGPYVQHIDEHFLLGASHKMLLSGDLDPGWYRYGSVSIQLCALGEALGYLDESRRGAWIPVSQLEQSAVPLMRPSRLGSWPRLLFALVGGLAISFAALCADRLRPRSGAGPLTVLLLVSQGAFQEQWFGYLNVNIIASFFAMAAIWAHVSAERDAPWLRISALPAALWGMAAATKYPMGVGVLSVVVADLLRRDRPRALQAVASLGVALLAFLALMPFALKNGPQFLSDLAFEANHYAMGHPKFTSGPGLDSAWHHTKAWLLPLGPAAVACLVGVWVTLRRYPWRLITLLGPGCALLLLFSRQATNFTRNSLLLGYLFSVLAAVGGASIYPWLLNQLSALEVPSLRLGARRALVAFAFLAVFFGPHWRAYAQLVGGHHESRDVLVRQLEKLPNDARVAIPHPQFMHSPAVKFVHYDATAGSDPALLQLEQSGATHVVVPLKWSRAHFHNEAVLDEKVAKARSLEVPGQAIWRGGVDEVWVHPPFHPRSNPELELLAIDRARLRAQLLGQVE